MKTHGKLWLRIITILIAAVLAAGTGLFNVQTYALGGIDEYVALDLVGRGAVQTLDADQTQDGADGQSNAVSTVNGSAGQDGTGADAAPLLEAGPYTFAEALAQEFRLREGSFVLDENSRFYIAVDEEDAGVSGSAGGASPDSGSQEPASEPGSLDDTVRLAASQFAALGVPGDEPLQVVYGEADKARAGDIVINLVNEDDFLYGIRTADVSQTYRLYVDEITIVESCSADGIWYGLTELMEIAVEKKSERNAALADADAAASGASDSGTEAAAADEGSPADTGSGAAAGSESDTEPTLSESQIVLDRIDIRDGPDLRERALMLDCGRKYYSREWIEELIRRASLQRYNAVILHFAEAEGIRLDSEIFPWLTEDIDSLTTDEMKEIVRTAQRYHIEIIPSFDTPGHNTFMVRKYAAHARDDAEFSFAYKGKIYDAGTKGFRSIANHYSYGGETESVDYIGIDLTKEHAVAFTNALIEGYADYFRKLGCTKFDIGSDELLGWYTFELGGETITYDNRWQALEHWKKYARNTLGIEKGSASDVLISYINDLAECLEHKGYTCRVFNDEIDLNPDQHVGLRKSIEVTYWFDADNSAAHYAEKGHMMHNFMESWCFYVLRSEKGKDIMNGKYKTVTGRNIWDNWNPRSFARKAGRTDAVPEEQLAGGYFAIWCDFPDYKDAETVFRETEMKTWANASRMWNSEVNSDKSGIRAGISYDDMKTFTGMLAVR